MSTTFLKKYKVLGKVGEGSFSEVLKCQDRETGAVYAAKRLKKIKESITDALKTPEVVAMRKLKQHPNILHLIESHFDPFPGKVTLIFELMDMSMYDLMKSRKRCLPEPRVKNYLYQLLKGIEHLHRHGLFHRDIKPENILLKNDVVKLADLGSVRGIFCKPPYTEYISTRWYRSPECLLTTGYYGPKMDVWATGCVFFELLTLKPLFPGANEMDQIGKIHNILGTPHARLISKFRRHKSRNCEYFFPTRPGTGLSTLLPNVSEGGRDVLKHMLVYDPEARPNVRRLLEHRYFNDLREQDTVPRRHSWSVSQANSPQPNPDWRNPALLSLLSNEKRKKFKRTSTTRRTGENQKVARVVVSSPNQRPAGGLAASTQGPAATTKQHKLEAAKEHRKEESTRISAQPCAPLTQLQPLAQPPAPSHSLHITKHPAEKTWTTAVSSSMLTSKPSLSSSNTKKIKSFNEAPANRSNIHLPKLPVRHRPAQMVTAAAAVVANTPKMQRVAPVRRGPSTITSLPTLDTGATATKGSATASFLRLPPIVMKKSAAPLGCTSRSVSDTGASGGGYSALHNPLAARSSFLSNRHASDKGRLATIEEQPTASDKNWKQLIAATTTGQDE